MDDLERWLRAAMQQAGQAPPASLLTGVWRRRRAHLRRVRAGGVAAVAAAAITVPSVLHATVTGTAPPARLPAAHTTPPRAAPGTELLQCGAYSNRGISGGQLDSRWKTASIQAGPVWFVYARSGGWRTSQQLPGGRLRDVAGPILAVQNGSTAEITTPPADRSRFRFLTHPTAPGTYTLRDGVPGLTLTACPSMHIPAGIPPGYAAGLTLFYLPLGYITDLPGCLTLQIATPPSWHARWTANLPVHGHSCKS